MLGCGMSVGNVRYRDNPDLSAVQLYVKHARYTGQEIGMISVTHTGFGSCSAVGEDGMRELLHEAMALGADTVEGVKFKHKFHWAGRIACDNRIFWRKTVRLT